MNQVAQVTTAITEAQAAAWLGMAESKNKLVEQLSSMELQAQSLLLPLADSEDYLIIDAALAEYRKLLTSLTETRKPFTNAVDAGIVQPLMAFEKRVKDAPEYATLTARSLQLRKVEAEKAALVNQRNQEIANFKAHVQNEFSRVVAEYRAAVRKEIASQYAMSIRAKVKVEDLTVLREALRSIPVPTVGKFPATLLTTEELHTIYAEVQKPNYTEYFDDLMLECEQRFSHYDSDVANAEAAIAEAERQAKLQALEEEKQLAEEQAITTLIASSEAVVVDTPRVKKTLSVTAIESEQWAKAVMAAFITNMPHLTKYIRVKSWSKLSIGQMAEYLGKLATDEGVTVPALMYTENEK